MTVQGLASHMLDPVADNALLLAIRCYRPTSAPIPKRFRQITTAESQFQMTDLRNTVTVI